MVDAVDLHDLPPESDSLYRRPKNSYHPSKNFSRCSWWQWAILLRARSNLQPNPSVQSLKKLINICASVIPLINKLLCSELGYQNIAMRIYPKGVTPECFNRGSSFR